MRLESLSLFVGRPFQAAGRLESLPHKGEGFQLPSLDGRGNGEGDLRRFVTTTFGYDLCEPLDSIRPRYRFDISCQGTVPPAITAFLESEDYEDAVRKAISLGGDSDTLVCIAGGIAEAIYGGVPQQIAARVRHILDDRLNAVVRLFHRRHMS